MLHLLPTSSYSDLCLKAIDSILTAYARQSTIADFAMCRAWDLDVLLDAPEPVIIKNVNPKAFYDYLVASEIRALRDANLWQVLPTNYRECDRVIQEIDCLTAKRVKVHFLLPNSQAPWEDIFAQFGPARRETIRNGGSSIHFLPELDLSAINYTMSDGEVNQSLLVGVSRLSPEIKADIKQLLGAFLGSARILA